MEWRTVVSIASLTATVVTILGVPLRVHEWAIPDVSRENTPIATSTVSRETPPDEPDHRLEVWLSALEWCESQGNGEAVNPNDLDGTPSYFWYQFKPGTFWAYGNQYGLLPAGATRDGILEKEMKDYELTRDIVRHMAQDPAVDMWGQFPGCMRKIGAPSKTSKKALCEADCPLIDPNAVPEDIDAPAIEQAGNPAMLESEQVSP